MRDSSRRSLVWAVVVCASAVGLCASAPALAQFSGTGSAAITNLLNGNPTPQAFSAAFSTPMKTAAANRDIEAMVNLRNAMAQALLASPPGRPAAMTLLNNEARAATAAGDLYALQLAQLLSDVQDRTSQTVLESMLTHADSGVRYIAARGVRRLINTGSAPLTGRSVGLLAAAASKEPSSATLREIYDVLVGAATNQESSAATTRTAALEAVAQILADRATNFYARKELSTAAVDIMLVRLAPDAHKGKGKTNIETHLPVMLKAVVQEYAAPPPTATTRLQEDWVSLIEELETACLQIANIQAGSPQDPGLYKAAVADWRSAVRRVDATAGQKWFGAKGSIFASRPWTPPASFFAAAAPATATPAANATPAAAQTPAARPATTPAAAPAR